MYNSKYELNVRHLAVIIVKNCVDQRWWAHSNSSTGNYLSEEEKELFSAQLVDYVGEGWLANRSCRFPSTKRLSSPSSPSSWREWPEWSTRLAWAVFSTCSSVFCPPIIRSSSTRACTFLPFHPSPSCSLLGVVRSFSTCRIGRQRQVFSKIVQDLTPFLVSFAYQLASSLPAAAEDSKPLLCEVLHRAMSVAPPRASDA